jgi:predicted nucleotidyltransferase component of viral defense system
MPDGEEPRRIDLSAWIAKAKGDPVKHRQRQVTEILLVAVAMAPGLRKGLYLKGGTLLNIAYQSPRATGDVDFTASEDPEALAGRIEKDLNDALRRAVARLGSPLTCRVQTIKKRPRPTTFAGSPFPALQMTIGSALAGTNEVRRLEGGQAAHVLEVEISFNEPVEDLDEIVLESGQAPLVSYSLLEVMAEKLRAFLQQKPRNRARRQDIYDLAFLIERFPFDEEERAELLRLFRAKCAAREIEATPASLFDPELSERARSQWETMRQELEELLPSYEDRFAVVAALYKSLPW